MRAAGAPVPLINYGATQTKTGVTVRVKNGRKTLKHAFIATMPNGHRGVFERTGAGHKRVTKKGRSYTSGLSIRELYGPSIPDALSNDVVQKAMARLVADKYPAILDNVSRTLFRARGVLHYQAAKPGGVVARWCTRRRALSAVLIGHIYQPYFRPICARPSV